MKETPRGFKVMDKQCATCIFKPGLNWRLAELLEPIRDAWGGFKGHRICHHSKGSCCRGFWNRYKNKFPVGQIAQRLGMVIYDKEERPL